MARQPDPQKREKLIKSAIAVFLKKGYRDATIADITKSAGLTTSNAYIYFENKEALLLAAMHRMMEEHTLLFKRLSRKSAGLDAGEFVDLCFNELKKIRPRILFMMHCVITPALTPLFEEFDFDYSGAFAPYFDGWPGEQATCTTRTLMAICDSYFLVGDIDECRQAAVRLLEDAGAAVKAAREKKNT